MPEFAPHFAAGQIIGDRERQEDAYAALDMSGRGNERFLFVVADGMGGHQGAAAVTQLAVRRFCELMKSSDAELSHRLQPALRGANDALAKAAILDATLEGAGCAFLSAAVEDGALSWISVGDCSLFLHRRGKLRKLNEDHSMRPVLAEMVATGRLLAKDAARDPRRHSLRSALKGSEIRLIDTSPAPLRLLPGDTIILASDGFETLSNRAIVKLLRPARATASKMVDRSLAAIRAARIRNQDNATVIFYSFGDIDDLVRSHRWGNGWRNLRWLALGVVLCAIGYGLYLSTP